MVGAAEGRRGRLSHVRILVTGAGGQLGRELVGHLETSPTHDVVGLARDRLDVADRDAVLGAVGTVRPDAIVHTAAWTAVDACEADPDRALVVNALGSRHVAEGARRFGAHLVALSTDYVFDGTKADPYHEWDEPAPTSAYGRSKLAGEHEVLAGCPGATVARTAWVCGAHGPNMVATVLRLAAERDQLAFVDDQRGSPTFTADLAPALVRLCIDRRPGVFHLTNAGAVSWYGSAGGGWVAAGAAPAGGRPAATADLDPPRPAPRPANSVLANTSWAAAGLAPLREFHQPLGELVDHLQATRHSHVANM